MLIAKEIIYSGRPCILYCDAKCEKAWGNHSRPKRQLSADPDDFEFLSDDELGSAPEDPGTSEGLDSKPISDDERLNKWCCRECERSSFSEQMPRERLSDFSRPVKNIP